MPRHQGECRFYRPVSVAKHASPYDKPQGQWILQVFGEAQSTGLGDISIFYEQNQIYFD